MATMEQLCPSMLNHGNTRSLPSTTPRHDIHRTRRHGWPRQIYNCQDEAAYDFSRRVAGADAAWAQGRWGWEGLAGLGAEDREGA